MFPLLKFVTTIPPLYCLACLGVVWLADRSIGGKLPLPAPISRGIAVGLLAAAGVLALWALDCFRRANTTWHPHTAPTAFVTAGPFAFTRNPMYLSLLLVLLAAVLWTRGIMILLAPVLFVIGMTVGRIREEERVLGESFGKEYAEYRRRVRRWV